MENSNIGSIVWQDITVENADALRDFYSAVVGWQSKACNMGDYDDYAMSSPSGQSVAGICHAKGVNSNMPPQWILYVAVANVAASIEQCLALGGSIAVAARPMGKQQFCVLQDPAGALIGIIGD